MFHVKQILSLFILCLFANISIGQKMMVFSDVKLPKPTEIDSKVDNWNKSQSNYAKLDMQSREFYYWVNYSRINPERFFQNAVLPIVTIYPQLEGENLKSLQRDLENAARLPLFALNDTLIKTASAHAIDVTKHNASPSHNSTDGVSFTERFKKSGMKTCGSENISYSGGDGDPLFMLVMLYIDINVPGLGHRKTLLNPLYITTGIAASKYKDGNTFLVQDFACAQN